MLNRFKTDAKRPGKEPHPWRIMRIRRVRELFTLHTLDLVRLRLPIGEGLLRLANETKDKYLAHVAHGVGQDINRGEPVYSAMARFPRVFPRSYIELVRAGEDVGLLDHSLDELLNHIRATNAFQGTLYAAITYFISLNVATIFVSGGLLVFVVPQFAAIFESFDSALPPLTQLLISISDALRSPYFLLGIAGLAFIIWIIGKRRRRRKESGTIFFRLFRRVPMLHALLVKRPLAEAAMVMRVMLRAGVPIEIVLEDLSLLSINPVLKQAFSVCYHKTVQGESLTNAFKSQEGVFPPEFIAAIALGESSECMDSHLENIAAAYRQDALRVSDVISEAVGPILICVTGLIVFFLYAGLFMPIINLQNIPEHLGDYTR